MNALMQDLKIDLRVMMVSKFQTQLLLGCQPKVIQTPNLRGGQKPEPLCREIHLL